MLKYQRVNSQEFLEKVSRILTNNFQTNSTKSVFTVFTCTESYGPRSPAERPEHCAQVSDVGLREFSIVGWETDQFLSDTENHRKAIGKPWENGGWMGLWMGFTLWFHQRSLAAGWKIPELNGDFDRKITELSMVHGFQPAMLDETGGFHRIS